MLILKYIEKSEYEAFILKHSSLFHSLEWGEFSKAYFKLTPHYLGLVKDSTLIAAVLLLQKEIDSNYSYFFIPGSIVLENDSKSIIKAMYSRINQFIRKKKGVFLQQLSNQLLPWKETKPLIDYSLPKEYKVIDLKEEKDDYLKNKIENEKYLAIEVYKGSKKDLINLSLDNHLSFYDTLYEVLNSSNNSKVSVFVEKIHLSTTVNNLEKRMKEINTQISILPIDNLSESANKKYKLLEEQKTNINKELNIYKGLKQKYKNDTFVFSNILIEYGKKAWILFDMNKGILEKDIEGYNTYLEEMRYCKNNGIETIYAPLRINDENKNIKNNNCYEYKINYLLYLLIKIKLK